MLKRTFMSLITLIVIASLGYSSFLAYGMYERYEETAEWENSSMLSEIHEVPPSLAKNYITPEEKRLFNVLTDVNIALNEIIKEGKVKESKQNEYWGIYDEAKKEIEKNQDLYEAFPDKYIFEDFSLYINADLTIKRAYDDLNTDKLDEYSREFAKRLSVDNVKIERNLFEQLKNISNDYFVLNEFSRKAIAQLGIIEKDVLKVGIQVDKSLTKSLLDEIETKKLSKFPHIKHLSAVLNSEPWNSILAHNVVTREYYSWKESQEILESLLKTNYVKIGSFKELGDVLAYDPSYPLKTKQNHTINKNSKVTDVYYQGQLMDEELYIKKGSVLTFAIDYEYTENPKSTITVEYLDDEGNELHEKTEHTDYVGNSVNLNVIKIEDYILDKIVNNLDEFPEEDSVIQIIYKEKPEEKEPEEIEEDTDENEDEVDEDEVDEDDKKESKPVNEEEKAEKDEKENGKQKSENEKENSEEKESEED